jgi:biopolymer transport protein ExbD
MASGAAIPPFGKKSKLTDYGDLVDMTAMVDIVFFLLIFFMVTTMGGVYSSISVPSPETKKVSTSSGGKSVKDFEDDAEFVVVRIDENNGIMLEGEEVLGEQDLRSRLRALHDGPRAVSKMLVAGSGESQFETVVMVLDAGNDVGIAYPKLAVAEED